MLVAIRTHKCSKCLCQLSINHWFLTRPGVDQARISGPMMAQCTDILRPEELILICVVYHFTQNVIYTLPLRKIADISQTTFSTAFVLDAVMRTSSDSSRKYVPKGWINSIPALVQIMAWGRSGDKPLYAPIMTSLLTHTCTQTCVTRPQWI